MFTLNWIGIVCLWVMFSVVFMFGWMVGHDKGYSKARREYQ